MVSEKETRSPKHFFFLTDVTGSEFSRSVFIFLHELSFLMDFSKYFFFNFHFLLPHIATKHPDTVAYVVKRHGICTKNAHAQTDFRVAASSAKSQVANLERHPFVVQTTDSPDECSVSLC